jgi:hypothetical protein
MLFALHKVSGASKTQASSVNGTNYEPNPYGGTPIAVAVPVQVVHSKGVSQPKRFIDGAATLLTSPFRSIVSSDNSWVTHGLPTLFALLAYGLGIGYVARFTSGMV